MNRPVINVALTWRIVLASSSIPFQTVSKVKKFRSTLISNHNLKMTSLIGVIMGHSLTETTVRILIPLLLFIHFIRRHLWVP